MLDIMFNWNSVRFSNNYFCQVPNIAGFEQLFRATVIITSYMYKARTGRRGWGGCWVEGEHPQAGNNFWLGLFGPAMSLRSASYKLKHV